MFRTPVTGQFLDNLIFGFFGNADHAFWAKVRGSRSPSTMARIIVMPVNTGDVRDGMMHTDVHLVQALLYAPDPVRALIDHGVAFTE